MKKLSEKGRRLCRKVLRAIYSGLGVIALSFLLPACPAPAYGMPPPRPYQKEHFAIQGQVKSQKTGEPVSGIGVWIIRNTIPYYSILTNTDGKFNFSMPKDDTAAIALVFTDIDGGENGGLFKTHTVNLTVEECEALTEPLDIELEEVDG